MSSILLLARHEEAARRVPPMRRCELNVAVIHPVERPGLWNQLIEEVAEIETRHYDLLEAGPGEDSTVV